MPSSGATKLWKIRNPERVLLHGREWRAKHREQLLRYGKNYRVKNREHVLEYARIYYRNHRDQEIKQSIEYGKKHRDRLQRSQNQRNREIRCWIVNQLGRKCFQCGLISEHDCIYDFHHTNNDGWSNTKSRKDGIKSACYTKWRKENKVPDDVILLCANCHRLEHFQN